MHRFPHGESADTRYDPGFSLAISMPSATPTLFAKTHATDKLNPMMV
jgi:hypothetical protein